jgi:hypothetical protein
MLTRLCIFSQVYSKSWTRPWRPTCIGEWMEFPLFRIRSASSHHSIHPIHSIHCIIGKRLCTNWKHALHQRNNSSFLSASSFCEARSSEEKLQNSDWQEPFTFKQTIIEPINEGSRSWVYCLHYAAGQHHGISSILTLPLIFMWWLSRSSTSIVILLPNLS